MSHFSLESEEGSIVFVGSFNPAIFHPEWLVRHELIPVDDLKGANVEIIHRDIAKFTLEWLSIDVVPNKLIARTNDPSKFSPLKDLMISTFKILEHTPINNLGMNYNATYLIDNMDNWHKIGNVLAPKSIWEQTLPKPVGLMALRIQSKRLDDLNGSVNVEIAPVPDIESGYKVRVGTNNHVDLKKEDDEPKVVDILETHWDKSIQIAKENGETTLKYAIEQ